MTHRRLAIAITLLLLAPTSANAFCGFYVAKADTALFNSASKVVMARDGDRTVITMANDFRGDPREFAIVIPVPTFLERDQINVGERAAIEHLDAYTAPRLVEYHDPDPCQRYYPMARRMDAELHEGGSAGQIREQRRELGVTIEARYAVGEYQILILSAEESKGLATWLRHNGYRLPRGAERVLASYVKQNMRFFVAKVDLDEQARLGYTFLRPLQVAYESPKFMLPIRLGTLNADGPQELFVFALTRTGRVETTNYRTVRLPSDLELPTLVADDFAAFYRDLFARRVERDGARAVYLEYAWDMAWCDPCAADPLSPAELRQLGVFWLDRPGGAPWGPDRNRRRLLKAQAQDVFVTRLHLRYTGDTFPEDLRFQETGDRSNFQGRYVMRRPWTGPIECAAGRDYRRQLRQRQEREAETLASLTGWPLEDIRRRMALDGPRTAGDGDGDGDGDGEPWWKRIWGR